MNTLAVVLAGHGLHIGQDGLAITAGNCSPAQLLDVVRELAAGPAPDPVALAATVRAKAHDKYDRYLSEELLNLAYAARALDVPGAWASLAELASLPRRPVETAGWVEPPGWARRAGRHPRNSTTSTTSTSTTEHEPIGRRGGEETAGHRLAATAQARVKANRRAARHGWPLTHGIRPARWPRFARGRSKTPRLLASFAGLAFIPAPAG
jgi:hypothetical protein